MASCFRGQRVLTTYCQVTSLVITPSHYCPRLRDGSAYLIRFRIQHDRNYNAGSMQVISNWQPVPNYLHRGNDITGLGYHNFTYHCRHPQYQRQWCRSLLGDGASRQTFSVQRLYLYRAAMIARQPCSLEPTRYHRQYQARERRHPHGPSLTRLGG